MTDVAVASLGGCGGIPSRARRAHLASRSEAAVMRSVLALALVAIAAAGCRASSTPTEPAECTLGGRSEYSLTCSMIGAAPAPDRRHPQTSSGPRAGGDERGLGPRPAAASLPAPSTLVGATCPRSVAPARLHHGGLR